jgi:hypothetical protein
MFEHERLWLARGPAEKCLLEQLSQAKSGSERRSRAEQLASASEGVEMDLKERDQRLLEVYRLLINLGRQKRSAGQHQPGRQAQ